MNIKKLIVGTAAGAIMFGVMVVPALASTGVLQGMISYYTKNDGGPFYRSVIPYTSGFETQSANPDGSVTMSIIGAPGYADSGFVIYNGKLGDLNNFNLTGTGDYGLNIWFDKNDNGEFFSWAGDTYSGVDGDSYILGPSSAGGNLSITDSSLFTSMQPGGGNYTLAQLKANVASGITSDTHIAIWVGVTVGSGGSKTATVSILVPAPTDKDQCKKGGWNTFNNPAFKNQGECVSYVQSNDHAGKR